MLREWVLKLVEKRVNLVGGDGNVEKKLSSYSTVWMVECEWMDLEKSFG